MVLPADTSTNTLFQKCHCVYWIPCLCSDLRDSCVLLQCCTLYFVPGLRRASGPGRSSSLTSPNWPLTNKQKDYMCALIWAHNNYERFVRVAIVGVLPKKWVGRCDLPSTPLTLFKTKTCDFPYLTYDRTKHLIPFLRSDTSINTLFQKCLIISSLKRPMCKTLLRAYVHCLIDYYE